MMGVAEAKRRFSELADRVARGEWFIVTRRDKPAVALAPPAWATGRRPGQPPVGLAAMAGALAEWEDLPAVMDEVVASRGQAEDRPPPELD